MTRLTPLFFRTFQRALSSAVASGHIVHKKEIKPKTVPYIPGDGVWPELFESVKEIFDAANVPVNFEEHFLSEVDTARSKSVDDVVAAIKEHKVAMKGIITTPENYTELKTVNMKLRRDLDMFANVVPVRSLPGIKTRHSEPLDFVVIREQTEGEYSALEHESVQGVVESLKIITRNKSERIAKFAFDYALRNGRKRVTAIHKANIMKLADGLFLESCRKISELYQPMIKFDSMIIDNCCMQMVSNPYQFDVMVMPNLYGSIIDNLASGLIGGAGVAPGESYSHEVAVFEPAARHSFVQAVGRDIANPTALLLSATRMLEHLHMFEESQRIYRAIMSVLQETDIRTVDIGGKATTSQFTRAIIDKL